MTPRKTFDELLQAYVAVLARLQSADSKDSLGWLMAMSRMGISFVAQNSPKGLKSFVESATRELVSLEHHYQLGVFKAAEEVRELLNELYSLMAELQERVAEFTDAHELAYRYSRLSMESSVWRMAARDSWLTVLTPEESWFLSPALRNEHRLEFEQLNAGFQESATQENLALLIAHGERGLQPLRKIAGLEDEEGLQKETDSLEELHLRLHSELLLSELPES